MYYRNPGGGTQAPALLRGLGATARNPHLATSPNAWHTGHRFRKSIMSLVPRKLRDGLHRLREGKPGRRFQDHYQERQQTRRGWLRRWLFLGGGTLVILAGLFFLPAPGPGFVIIFLGGGLVAQESLVAARALDWTELRLRKVASALHRIWRSCSTPLKVLIVVVGAALAGAAAYVAYLLLFAR